TGIENDDFGCALDTEGLRARAIGVLDEGKLDPKINRLLRQLRNAVVERDIHRKELHCLAAIRLIELLELRPIALRDRACGIGEDENVSLLVPEVFQRARQVADVLEMQLRDDTADDDPTGLAGPGWQKGGEQKTAGNDQQRAQFAAVFKGVALLQV